MWASVIAKSVAAHFDLVKATVLRGKLLFLKRKFKGVKRVTF